MIRVGIAGIGFMGLIHYLAYQKVRGAKVASIATRNEKRLAGDWRGIQGNFGPPGTKMDLGAIGRYRSLDEMLADERIDLVDICLPPALHADAAVAALKAGKHVFCEKPIALSTRDATRMTRTAERAGKLLLIGHVLPFFPEYAYARKLIDSGRYGRPIGGRFKRIISEPTWLPDFFDLGRVGGPLIDLHIHDAHFIRLVWGLPKSVFSCGRMRGDVPEFVETQFLFDDEDVIVSAASGVIPQQGRPFTHGYEIYFERATLTFDFAALATGAAAIPLTLLTPDGKVRQPALAGGDPVDAFVAELDEVCRAVRQGKASPLLDGTLAQNALVLCERQMQSAAKRRAVNV